MSDHLEPAPPLVSPYPEVNDNPDRRLEQVRHTLASQLEDALAALAKEQRDNDEFRRELGYEPIGCERVYSGPELNQHRGQIVISHWVGNGMRTTRQS